MKNFMKKKEQQPSEKKSPYSFITSKSGDGDEIEVAASPVSTSTSSSTAAASSSAGVVGGGASSKKFSFNRFKKDGGVETAVATTARPQPPSPTRSNSEGRKSVVRAHKGSSTNKSSSKKKSFMKKSTMSSRAPSMSKKKETKKASEFDNQEDEYENKRSKKMNKSSSSSSGGSSSCCGMKRLMCTSCVVLISTIIGVLIWRYGPWAKDSAQVLSLETTASCPNCCNGLVTNCNKSVNDVLFPMVHQSHSSSENNFVGASNTKSLEEALVAGYRALQLSTCMCELMSGQLLLERDPEWGLGESNLGFCHTACGAGVRDPKDVLSNLKTFIETNPREVLIIQFEFGDGSAADFRTALQFSGLLEYVYLPQEEYYIEEWPTLQQLINDNKRIILFGSGDTMESCPAKDCLDGILYTFDHVSQTNTDGTDLTDCTPTISGDVFVGYLMMNHYKDSKLTIPSVKDASELNSYSNLENRFATCNGKRQPNLLAVQFWDEGDVLDFVTNVNKGDREFLLASDEDGGEEEEEEEDEEEDVIVANNTYEGPSGGGEETRRGLRG